MKKHLSISIALIFSLLISTQAGQQTQPASQEPPAKEKQDALKKNDVVKISVTLVQVDVTVTDKKGKPVTDLRAEDFEISQDKRPQHITNFSYVTAQPVAAAADAVVARRVENNSVAMRLRRPCNSNPNRCGARLRW